MRKRINVTARDVSHGTPGDGSACPVYLAAKRVLPVLAVGYESMEVASTALFVGHRRDISLPQPVIEWIKRYDRDGNAEPFSFWIEVPE